MLGWHLIASEGCADCGCSDGRWVALKFVSFQSVSSLTFFVEVRVPPGFNAKYWMLSFCFTFLAQGFFELCCARQRRITSVTALCCSLMIIGFSQSNTGDEDATVIQKIAISGATIQGTNMDDLKKCG